MRTKHIFMLLMVVATILIVGCPEPTKDKGGSATPPTIKQLLSSLATAVDMPEKTKAEKVKKQNKIQSIYKLIEKTDPKYKHKPETKDELAMFIKAEIWKQGKDGKKNWEANLDEIDTSQVKDMSYLFSADDTNGYGLHEYSGEPSIWVLNKPKQANNMYEGSQAQIPTWYSIEKLKTEVEKESPSQADIKALIKKITKGNQDYKHRPTNKGELVMFVKAEIWAQGTGGKQNWEADLNNIDTSQVKDMSYLFSADDTNGYGLHEYSGEPSIWALNKPKQANNMYEGSQAQIPTWYSIEKLKTEVEKESPSQADIKALIKKITKGNQDYKHRPTNKGELVMFVKAEIWAQGTGGKQNWEADLNNIDTSQVKDFAFLFANAKGHGLSAFNGNINGWDVSSVTNMYGMFQNAKTFNQPLNEWGKKVGKVTNMQNMFVGAEGFNQPLNKWDVSKVTNMQSMFNGAIAFDQEIKDWDVSSVTNMDGMFQNAKTFNQPLNEWGEKVGKVTSMNAMFWLATSFNQPLNEWDVSKVTSMYAMFYNAIAFNKPLNEWDVSKVTSMNTMFWLATSFNQPLNEWDVSSVTSMHGMFWGATAFKQNLNEWGEHLKNKDDKYKKINVQIMFDRSGVIGDNTPAWYKAIK